METIRKEAVELNNSYSSNSSSRGISTGVTIGYGHGIQTTGNGVSISASRSNSNTVETIYANGNFTNVNEVHNNTQNMIVRGFNQEGGKVTGNINNLEVTSLQNTSTTTGSSRGVSLGIGANGIPNSIGLSGSNTNGSRAYVDNQTTFIIGEGSNLTVGRAENTGGIIGKEENSTFKIGEYTGKDLNNYDTMRTTGGSIGLQTGSVPVSNLGYNQDTRDKEGITRNTVVGNVEIRTSSGSPINRDLNKANETTRDESSSTNINIESQTIEYALNPTKFKEDIEKAKQEVKDVGRAISESVNDRGDDNRNFFGQLREIRLNETINNIAGERLERATTQEDMKGILEAAYKDLGYEVNIRFSTPGETPELKDKGGTAYIGDDGKHTVIINSEYLNGKSKGEILGIISEEASHIINGVEGRAIATGTDEKGLESTGRATKEYFEDKYKDDKTTISLTSEGSIDTSKLGTNVGDKYYIHTKNSINAQSGSVIGFNDDELKKIKEALENKTGYILDYEEIKTGDKKGDLEIKIIGKKEGVKIDDIDNNFKYIIDNSQSLVLGKGDETVTGKPTEVYDYIISFSFNNDGKYRYNPQKGYSEVIKYDSLTETTLSLGHEENHIQRYMMNGVENETNKGFNLDKGKFKPDKITSQRYNLDENKIYEGVIVISEDEYKAIKFESELSKKIGAPYERKIYDVDIYEDENGIYIREAK